MVFISTCHQALQHKSNKCRTTKKAKHEQSRKPNNFRLNHKVSWLSWIRNKLQKLKNEGNRFSLTFSLESGRVFSCFAQIAIKIRSTLTTIEYYQNKCLKRMSRKNRSISWYLINLFKKCISNVTYLWVCILHFIY